MGKKTGSALPEIPQYALKGFRHLHRQEDDTSNFGYNNLESIHTVDGFELYSSRGLKPSVGPLKSAFYRISITITGHVDMQLGLEHFKHQPGTMSFTWPNQVFSKNNISADAFGYYILFNEDFLNDLIPATSIPKEFPFFDYTGRPLFQLDPDEIDRVQQFVLKMNEELKENRPAKEKGQSERGPRSKHSDSSTWKPSQCDKFPISSGLSKGTFLPWNIRVLDIQVGGSLL